MKKRFLSIILAIYFTICYLPCPALAAEDTGFSDVKTDDWFAPYVAVCVEEGLMQGTGDGRFDPQRELTDAEAMTLAYRLYDKSQGGDGSVEHAPEDWNRFTMTLSNGVEITGYGDDEIDAGPFSYFDGYSQLGCLTAVLYYGEGVKDAVEGAATVSLNGKTYVGRVEFVNVSSGLTFFPEGYPSDPEAITAYTEIQQAFYQGVDPKFWWRDVCYTIVKRGWDELLRPVDFGRFSACRREFAVALAAVAGELEVINPHIQQVPDSDEAEVLALYRAGILTGVDELGQFKPLNTLTRAEAAAMLARVLRPDLRVRLDKRNENSQQIT